MLVRLAVMLQTRSHPNELLVYLASHKVLNTEVHNVTKTNEQNKDVLN